ncbi:MAG: hypothetical protein RL112_1890, partial [Planctomycetota bacterium]
ARTRRRRIALTALRGRRARQEERKEQDEAERQVRHGTFYGLWLRTLTTESVGWLRELAAEAAKTALKTERPARA